MLLKESLFEEYLKVSSFVLAIIAFYVNLML